MDARVYDQDPSTLNSLSTRIPGFQTAAVLEDSFHIIQHTEISQNTRHPSTQFEPTNETFAGGLAPTLSALEELPLLQASLSARKQRKLLTQASRYLSTCALDFCNRYELPNTVIQGMEPREQPFIVRNLGRKRAPECGWSEFAFLLRFLIAEQQIPAGALKSDLATHFRAILHISLGVDDILRHPQPLRDDRTILRILSAGVQVARMLNDLYAINTLDDLLMKAERAMITANA